MVIKLGRIAHATAAMAAIYHTRIQKHWYGIDYRVVIKVKSIVTCLRETGWQGCVWMN